MGAEFAMKDLLRRWVHSHEEDRAGRTVFRPAEWSFPPSRGRRSLELRADGVLLESAPGATDAPRAAAGRWRLVGPGHRLELEREGAGVEILVIDSLAPERLVVRRP